MTTNEVSEAVRAAFTAHVGMGPLKWVGGTPGLNWLGEWSGFTTEWLAYADAWKASRAAALGEVMDKAEATLVAVDASHAATEWEKPEEIARAMQADCIGALRMLRALIDTPAEEDKREDWGRSDL